MCFWSTFGYYEQEQRAWVFSRSMLEMMKDKGPVWDEIVIKNELLPTKLDQVGGWCRSMLEMMKDKGPVWDEIVIKNELLPTKLDQTISSMKKTKKSKVKKSFNYPGVDQQTGRLN
nr:3-oxo-delta(4,5)-steroid 5-beta-reductase [Tanacetum cinerariifolium]GEZ95932.1 3-oxo-delta(4,5)-steroid 5-beta-reductase [Tanacetum cinerariifolium]